MEGCISECRWVATNDIFTCNIREKLGNNASGFIEETGYVSVINRIQLKNKGNIKMKCNQCQNEMIIWNAHFKCSW